MLDDIFNRQKQQIWPFRKRQGLWFPHCKPFWPRFGYENPSVLFYRRKPKANYTPPNRYLPKLVVGCPWAHLMAVYGALDIQRDESIWSQDVLYRGIFEANITSKHGSKYSRSLQQHPWTIVSKMGRHLHHEDRRYLHGGFHHEIKYFR